MVINKSDAPSCGTSSSRFGCWTCTVVEKDKSLAGFVDAGFLEFGPLIEFRDWLVEIRNDPALRSAMRRTGKYTITDGGTFVPGPFTIEARHVILDRLLALQERVGKQLITPDEVGVIKDIWAAEAATPAFAGTLRVL